MTYQHLKVRIDGLLALDNCELQLQWGGYITDNNGNKLRTAKQIRAALEHERAKGYEVLPMGDCDNFDPVKGCLGHVIEPKQVTAADCLKCNCWEVKRGRCCNYEEYTAEVVSAGAVTCEYYD